MAALPETLPPLEAVSQLTQPKPVVLKDELSGRPATLCLALGGEALAALTAVGADGGASEAGDAVPTKTSANSGKSPRVFHNDSPSARAGENRLSRFSLIHWRS
jgi:hypothetical protein